jgi:dihydroxycyclohexadiene carboxylate dehydrogenase
MQSKLSDRFSGKVALVTGAAQGIGKSTAIRLAAEGASVILVDRVLDACLEVEAHIRAFGTSAITIACDLETPDGASTMVEQALDWQGALDVAVHNVGGTIWTKPFWDYEIDEIEREIRRSLWPTLLCSRAVIPVMIKQKRGSIVNIGSTATRGQYRVPYAAAKGGVAAMSVAMSLELAQFDIRVNCVVPGFINSNRKIPRNNMPPTDEEKHWRNEIIAQSLQDSSMKRGGEADEVAAAIAFYASDDASFMTGQIAYVSGGAIG